MTEPSSPYAGLQPEGWARRTRGLVEEHPLEVTEIVEVSPKLRLIRFGWLDHTDWEGQKAASGQQARLPPHVEQTKLIVLYDADNVE